MSRSTRFAMLCTSVAVCVASSRTSHAQAEMSNFYLGINANYSYGTGVSADGLTAAGYASSPTSASGFHAMKWTREGGMQDLGLASGQSFFDSTAAYAMSRDGSTIVGKTITFGSPTLAFRWSAGGYQSLGTLSGGTTSSATGVSGDGSVVTGTGDSTSGSTRSFVWTSGSGMMDIGTLAGGTMASATGISADGLVVVGNGDSSDGANRAFRYNGWGIADIGVLSGATETFANAVNADGSVIVGSSGTTTSDQRMFRWVNGSMQDLGLFPGSTSTTAYGVSPDGNVIVGGYIGTSGERGFIWRPGAGYQDLTAFAISLGFNFGGPLGPWITRADAVSSTGSTIAGYSTNFNTRPMGFVLWTPVPEPLSILGLSAGLGLLARRRRKQ